MLIPPLKGKSSKEAINLAPSTSARNSTDEQGDVQYNFIHKDFVKFRNFWIKMQHELDQVNDKLEKRENYLLHE